jgi:hypothetical protein
MHESTNSINYWPNMSSSSIKSIDLLDNFNCDGSLIKFKGDLFIKYNLYPSCLKFLMS